MSMKDCVSLEIAKKLKEAGWPLVSEFHWYKQVGGIVVDTEVKGQWIIRPKNDLALGFGEVVAAPTIGELLEALPDQIETKQEGWYDLLLMKDDPTYHAYYRTVRGDCAYVQTSLTPADALALLWIALKEKGLV